MKIQKIQKNTGFSLIETIIYISIFSMIVTTIVSFSSSMTSMRLHNQILLEVKYTDYLPDFVRDLISSCCMTKVSNSKYSIALDLNSF